MQAILEAAREYGFFKDDGDPAGWHFVTNSFTKDDTWRDFDLSAHVPEHAKAVLFRIRSRTTALGVDNYLRSRAKVFFANVVRMENPVANVFGEHNVVCQCDSDRFIQYKIDGVRTNVFNMVIMGWWF